MWTLWANSGCAVAVPVCTMRVNASSCASSQVTSTGVYGIPPNGSSASGASRVHSTTESGSGSPDATPSVNG